MIEEKQAKLDKQIALLDERSKALEIKEKCTVTDSNTGEALNKVDQNLVANYLNSFNSISNPTADATATLMPTVMVRVLSEGEFYGPVRALLDSGAQPNLMPHSVL